MFTTEEIGVIANLMGQEMQMRLSPYGNPIVKHQKTKGNNVIFSFYKHPDGFVIRKRFGYPRPFGHSHILNGGKHFPDIQSAMAYFAQYKTKYADRLVG